MAEVSSQTLHLVARELASELNEARAALETFGEQQDNVALLRKCGEHLHSVHGALRVSEVYGAALLAEEMGQVTRYLLDHFAEKRHLAEGLDALMRAMVQLPTYLERVLSGGRDMALVLLPLLNDLRAVRGHALLSEGTLLLLNLSSDQQANPSPQAPGEGSLSVAQWARKLRTRFQLGLLGWIKGERVEQNLEVLSRVAEKLEQLATTQPVFQLWWVVGAVLESLREHGLESSASVKRLLGQADRDMKRLYEQGEPRYSESPSLELLNNLLYYVARARSNGPRVTAVRASFRLSELLPVDDNVEQARESLSAPSVKLMKTVAAAIKEDLSRVKDALDIFVRQGGTQVDDLSPQLELLKKIADTLGVLGLGELRDKVQTETTDLQAIVSQRAPVNEGILLRMASTLIKVEDSLDEQLISMIVPMGESETPQKPAGADDIEFRQVTEAVLRECIVNMARIKEAIALSMEKPRESHAIEQIPPLVRGITAGLLMLGKPRVVEIMQGIDKALSQFMRADGLTLPPEAVDRLADAIVAVEYYMETIQAGRTDPWYMLDNADACLLYLAETQPVPRVEPVPEERHFTTMVIEPLSQTVAAPTEHHERTAFIGKSAASPAQDAPREAPKPAPAPTAPVEQIQMPPALAKPADREIDPEFLELFIEEAKDEILRLQQFFPRWDENPQEQEALTNIRRSFHTLKGSGRMVGAQLIGEFAWSIENLLNRVINKTLDRTPDMMSLLREAVAAVPELVEQLEAGREPRVDVSRIINQAYTMAGGRPASATKPAVPAPAALRAPAPVAAVAPVQPVVVEALQPVYEPPEPPTLTTTAIVEPIVQVPEKKTASTSQPGAPLNDGPMEAVLSEIYAKETAGHLAAIRDYIAACALTSAPYIVTDDLHRSCHTLSGTAKTAGARQGIKIAEPLNRYIRKLYDNSTGLPAAGLEVLKDAVNAIQQVVDHINEDTGYFPSHARLIARITELEHQLDSEISRLAETVGAVTSVILDEPVGMPAAARSNEIVGDTEYESDPAAPAAIEEDAGPLQTVAAAADDVIELPPIEASTLTMLEWSFKNFPDEPANAATPDSTAATMDSPLVADILIAAAADVPDGTRSLESLVIGDGAQEIVLDTPEPSATDPAPEPIQLRYDNGFLTSEELEAQPELDASLFAELRDAPDSILVAETETVVGISLKPVFAAAVQAPADRDAFSMPAAAPRSQAAQEYDAPGDEEIVLSDDPTSEEIVLGGEPASEEIVLSEPTVEPPQPPVELLDREPAPVMSQQELPPIEAAPSAAPQWQPEPVAAAPVAAQAAAPASAPAAAVLEDEGDDVDANFDPDIAAIFTDEASELLESADGALAAWKRDQRNDALVFELKRSIHTLKGGARMAGIRAMGDLSHEMETFMQLVEAGQVPASPEAFSTLQSSLDALHRMRDVVSSGGRSPPARELMARLRALGGYGPPVEEAPAPVAQPETPAHVETASVEEPAPAPASYQEPAYDSGIEVAEAPASYPEVAEAQPLVSAVAPEESVELAADESIEVEAEFGADELGAAAPRESVRVDEHVDVERDAYEVATHAPELEPDQEAGEAAEAQTFEPAPAPAPALPPGREPVVQERQEFARVDADLLDMLLNNAGEVSIFRSRLEQQVGSIEFNLAELGRTVTRLRDQLRKLELETEAEILHRHREEHPDRTDFDPLELDRYSTIQQLTRAFAESVSDVGSIEGLLENLTREAQNLLLQQSRVVTELQNGLMRTRMVPFQRHVQRLSRLVRQVATDTGKRADLVVVGASGELDRQVLERMLPPFEHMLRNSVVHGIETPQERVAAGKPESGTIKVGLHREGSEMVIVLEDDGRGIDVKAVRERAAARGLLQAGRVLSDEEAMQLILEPGFSTASAITQHAGRGVGMDVVVTEIKRLGGALFTSSVVGQGVKFTIRLPFTLAITQALIVRTGEELYALPLPTVEGVARVPKSDVQRHLAEETPTFNYGGQIYRLQHLGAFVGGGPSQLPETDVAVPLILIRAGEHSTALVCDELVGSREMVVKSVGPQIAAIRGISGATIMGDGRIVMILDMGALVRSEWRSRRNLEVLGPVVDRRIFALVVDDSITVRRVTQRFLERNGMRVMTAKDGIDALSILQEHLPDVILLDIEMPRMDGYELASQVRADGRLQDIPIVMITSRVGEKHRARAIEIGVNDYLGKPYQENELLDAIEPLVEARRQKAAS